jgi:hypothetical protein
VPTVGIDGAIDEHKLAVLTFPDKLTYRPEQETARLASIGDFARAFEDTPSDLHGIFDHDWKRFSHASSIRCAPSGSCSKSLANSDSFGRLEML